MLLWIYTDGERRGITWVAASQDAAHHVQRGKYYARQLRQWAQIFIGDRSIPENRYGHSRECILEHEDIAQEILLHLQGIGKHVCAQDIVTYLDRPDVKARLKLKKTTSLATAQRWMAKLEFRFGKAPRGQYIDGHERPDVVKVRQEEFLPAMAKVLPSMRTWNDGQEDLPQEIQWPHDEDDGPRPFQNTVVTWCHDESIFRALDRRSLYWVHASEKAVPQPKTDGASLMASEFVSADYGWLQSRDGKNSARILFKPGKNRDGYLTNDDIVDQANTAMDILDADYKHERHVFIYDNVTTHTKRAPEAPSASKMPKNMSTRENNWMVEVNALDANGKQCYNEGDGSQKKMKVKMHDAVLEDGTPQSFYYADNDPIVEWRGLFKGMAAILEERGYEGCTGKYPKGRRGNCPDYSLGCVEANGVDCCC